MSKKTLRDWINCLKEVVDGHRVAASLGLHHKRKGRRYFCPTCQPTGGTSPDLSVGAEGFHCFKCGAKGDLVALVQLSRDCDFTTAVDWLAAEMGQERLERTTHPQSNRSRQSQKPLDAARSPVTHVDANYAGIYAAFLAGCRPVEGAALDYLTGRGIASTIVEHLGLRFCGQEYADLMTDLQTRFSIDTLLAAGLLMQGKRKPYPTFWPYFTKQVGFLVLPYIFQDYPVYLKARPPIDKATAKARGVIRFMNTGGAVPCLYNADALIGASRVLICEGETDTLTALTHGYTAVGIPGWSHFKAEWVKLFSGKTVFLVLDADVAGATGTRSIAQAFERASLPLPRHVILPAGQDLTDFFNN